MSVIFVDVDDAFVYGLFNKALIVALDAEHPKAESGKVFVYAEEVYRFCDRNQFHPKFALAVKELLASLSGDSPAIRAAKRHQPEIG